MLYRGMGVLRTVVKLSLYSNLGGRQLEGSCTLFDGAIIDALGRAKGRIHARLHSFRLSPDPTKASMIAPSNNVQLRVPPVSDVYAALKVAEVGGSNCDDNPGRGFKCLLREPDQKQCALM
jgi:hypothetical protein